MIRFDHVSFGYGLGKNVINDFTLMVPEGARIRVNAPSGGGKTTLLRLLLGLEKPRKGSISGCEGLRFSAVFQEDRLLPWKTVLENVTMFSDEECARAMLVRLGLEEVLTALPDALSGGMKRRVSLARALCHPFDILVLDEPFTGLDDANKELCIRAISDTLNGRTLILTTHDAADAEKLQAKTFDL